MLVAKIYPEGFTTTSVKTSSLAGGASAVASIQNSDPALSDPLSELATLYSRTKKTDISSALNQLKNQAAAIKAEAASNVATSGTAQASASAAPVPFVPLLRGLGEGDIKRLLEAVEFGDSAVQNCVNSLCSELGLNDAQLAEIMALAQKLSASKKQVSEAKEHLLKVQQRTLQEQQKLASMRASLPASLNTASQDNTHTPITDFAYPKENTFEGKGPDGGMREGFTLPTSGQRAALALEQSTKQQNQAALNGADSASTQAQSAHTSSGMDASQAGQGSNASASAVAANGMADGHTQLGTFDGRKKVSTDERYAFSSSDNTMDEIRKQGRSSLLSEQLASQIPTFDPESEWSAIRSDRALFTSLVPRVRDYLRFLVAKEAEISADSHKGNQHDTKYELNALNNVIAGIQSFQQSQASGVPVDAAASNDDALKLNDSAKPSPSIMQMLMDKLSLPQGAESSVASASTEQSPVQNTDDAAEDFAFVQQDAHGYDVNDPRHLGAQLVSSISLSNNDSSIAPGGSFEAPPAPPQLSTTDINAAAANSADANGATAATSSSTATATTVAAAAASPFATLGSSNVADSAQASAQNQSDATNASANANASATANQGNTPSPLDSLASVAAQAAGQGAVSATDLNTAQSAEQASTNAAEQVSTSAAAQSAEQATDHVAMQASADSTAMLDSASNDGGDEVKKVSDASAQASLSLAAGNEGVALSKQANNSLAAMVSSLAEVEGHGDDLSIDDIMGTDFIPNHGDLTPAAQILSGKSESKKASDDLTLNDKQDTNVGSLLSGALSGDDSAANAAQDGAALRGGAATDSLIDDEDLPPWDLTEEEMKRFRKLKGSDALPQAADLSKLDNGTVVNEHAHIFTNNLSGAVTSTDNGNSKAMGDNALGGAVLSNTATAVDNGLGLSNVSTASAAASANNGSIASLDKMAMSLANEAESAVEGGAVIASAQGHAGTLNVNATALTSSDISNDAKAQDSQKKMQAAASDFEKATAAIKSARTEDERKALEQKQAASALDLLNSFGDKVEREIELSGGNQPSPWDNLASVTVINVNGTDIKLNRPPKTALKQLSDSNFLLDSDQAHSGRKVRIFNGEINPFFGEKHDFAQENGTVEQYLSACEADERNLMQFDHDMAKACSERIEALKAQGQDYTKPHIDLLRLLARSNSALDSTLPKEVAGVTPQGQAPNQEQSQAPVQQANVATVQQPPMPGQTPAQMPGAAPVQMSGQMPGQMSNQMPGQMSNQMLGQMNGQMAGQMNGQKAPGNGQNFGNQFVSGPQGMPPMQGQMGQGNVQNFGNGQNYNQGQRQMGPGQGQGQGYDNGPQQGNGNFSQYHQDNYDFGQRPDYIAADDDFYESSASINISAVAAASNMGSDDDYFDDASFGPDGGASMDMGPMFDAAEAALDSYGAALTPTEVVGSNMPAVPTKAPAFKMPGKRLMVEDDFLQTLESKDPWYAFLKKVYPEGGPYFSILTGAERRIDPNDENHWFLVLDEKSDWGYIAHNFWDDTRQRFESELGHAIQLDVVTEPQIPRGAPIIEARFALQEAIAKERQNLTKLDGLSKLMRMIGEDIANASIELYVSEPNESQLAAK